MEETLAELPFTGDQVDLFRARPGRPKRTSNSRVDPATSRQSGSVTSVNTAKSIPWWKEPTKDQWLARVAAWLGWTLDAFDFTIFLLIMLPISEEFNVPLTAVTAVFP